MVVERRTPPDDPHLIAAAEQQAGGWVYDIDWPYPEEQRTPPEAIRGGWEVGKDGRLTGMYAPNSRYRAVEHCDRILKSYVHAAARNNPEQWITEIDPRGEGSFPDIPEAMIRGWWFVDAKGIITSKFRPNSRWMEDKEHKGK